MLVLIISIVGIILLILTPLILSTQGPGLVTLILSPITNIFVKSLPTPTLSPIIIPFFTLELT